VLAAHRFQRYVFRPHVPLQGQAVAAYRGNARQHIVGIFRIAVDFEQASICSFMSTTVRFIRWIMCSTNCVISDPTSSGPSSRPSSMAKTSRADCSGWRRRVNKAPPVAPQLHGHHVLGIGAGVEVDRPERRHQRLPFAKGAGPCVVAGEEFRGRFGNLQRLLQPLAHTGQRAVEVQPQHLLVIHRCPLLRLGPSNGSSATPSVEHTAEQQRAVGAWSSGAAVTLSNNSLPDAVHFLPGNAVLASGS
jgi:hypothetical protein